MVKFRLGHTELLSLKTNPNPSNAVINGLHAGSRISLVTGDFIVAAVLSEQLSRRLAGTVHNPLDGLGCIEVIEVTPRRLLRTVLG